MILICEKTQQRQEPDQSIEKPRPFSAGKKNQLDYMQASANSSWQGSRKVSELDQGHQTSDTWEDITGRYLGNQGRNSIEPGSEESMLWLERFEFGDLVDRRRKCRKEKGRQIGTEKRRKKDSQTKKANEKIRKKRRND